MADSSAFEAACACLEERGGVDRLVARGTIRLVLKEAGLEPRTVTAPELAVALKQLLPAQLTSRGLAEPEQLCESVVQAIHGVSDRGSGERPEAIFSRLGGA